MNPILPVNVDAERSILGAILLNQKAFDEVSALGLTSRDFSLDSHSRIYVRMTEIAESFRPIDTITLLEELERHRELGLVGDAAYVARLLDGVPDRPSVKQYARIVLEKSAGRKLIHACDAAISSLGTGSSSREALEALGESVLQIQSGSDEAPAQRVGNFTDQVLRAWGEVADGDGDLIGLATGVDCLDSVTTGIRPSELWVIAGRTGDGKTSLALQAAAANCRKERAVGFFSLEMSKGDLLQRLWANEGNIAYRDIRYPRNLQPETRESIKRAAVAVAQWPLFVIEDSSLTIQKLVAKARLLIRQERLQLLVVDYAQLISAPARDERERLTKVSNALRALAKDTGVPVLAISQLSRPKDGNPNARPNKFHLKESGSLENDAHVIVLAYRPVDRLGETTGEDELIVAKQRAGMVSNERVRFDSGTLAFYGRDIIAGRPQGSAERCPANGCDHDGGTGEIGASKNQ